MGEGGPTSTPKARLWLQPGVRGFLLWLYGIPLAGNLNVVLSITASLWHYSRGDTVDKEPLLRIWLVFTIVGTIIASWILGIVAIVKWRKIPLLLWNGVATMALSLSPGWVAGLYYVWFMELRGLEWFKLDFKFQF